MILDSLLTGVMLFSSFAIRTPNVQPNPDDYEISIGIDHPSYHLNRQWERELGGQYVDDLFWAKLDGAGVYFKPEYLNKESQSIKYLKPKGRMIFSSINRTILSKILAIFLAEEILHWVPKKTHTYNKLVKPEELMFFIEKNNMKTIDITGLIYNPMIGEWSLNKNLTKINYFFTAEKI